MLTKLQVAETGFSNVAFIWRDHICDLSSGGNFLDRQKLGVSDLKKTQLLRIAIINFQIKTYLFNLFVHLVQTRERYLNHFQATLAAANTVLTLLAVGHRVHGDHRMRERR